MKRVGATRTEVVPSSPIGPSHSSAESFSRVIEMPAGTKYSAPLSLYSEPPLCEVTIEEFEELALGRLERMTSLLYLINMFGSASKCRNWIDP
jgi:hypothetical protein